MSRRYWISGMGWAGSGSGSGADVWVTVSWNSADVGPFVTSTFSCTGMSK